MFIMRLSINEVQEGGGASQGIKNGLYSWLDEK